MTYALLFFASLLCEISSNIPVGSMPLALVAEGASDSQAAIAMGCGMFASLIFSLPIGLLVDRVGRLPVMRGGALLSVFVMLAMGGTHGIIAGCLQMTLRSTAMVAYMTAQFAYASNMFSRERAVSAAGALGILGNVAMAIGPAFGVWLWGHGIHREQFLWATLLNMVAFLAVLTLPKKYDLSARSTQATRLSIFVRPAWLPAMLFMLCAALHGGVNGALAVLAFRARGLENGALIFTATALTTVVLRYPVGRLVEKYGAVTLAIPTVLLQGCGCLLAARAYSPAAVIGAGILLGTAWAAVVPIGLALFFEKSSQRSRGTAMGCYNLALGGGSALGALIATIATANGMGYTESMNACAFVPCIALIILLATNRKKGVKPEHQSLD